MKQQPYPDKFYPTEINMFNIIILKDIKQFDGTILQTFDTFWFNPKNINSKINLGKQGSCNLGSVDDCIKRMADRGYTVNIISDYRTN
jgi:hypothetical protein